MRARGLSPTVGVLVIVGLVAVLAVSLLTVSAGVLSGAESSAQTNQVEYSMTQLSMTAERLVAGETDAGAFPDRVNGQSGSLDESAGHVEFVLVHEDGSTETLLSEDLGVYRYELPTGTDVAYQGGGVWRRQGEETDLVTPPSLHYRQRPEPTLTFPLVRLAASNRSGPIDGRLRVEQRREVFPSDRPNPIEARNLYVVLESEYCEGWQDHFERRTDGTVDEGCEASGATSAPDELRVNLTGPGSTTDYRTEGVGIYSEESFETWNASLTINATIGAGNDTTIHPNTTFQHDGRLSGGVERSRDPHDDELQSLLDDANASDWETFCGGPWNYNCEYEGGQTVYIDDFAWGSGDVTFDLSQGDLTLVVDDELLFANTTTWQLENYEGNHVEVYTTGNMTFGGYLDLGPDGGPGSLQPLNSPPSDTYPEGFRFYGTSDAVISFEDTVGMEAIVSAPSAGTGNVSRTEFEGGSVDVDLIGWIYAGRVDLYEGTFDVYQPSDSGAGDLTELEPWATDEPDLYYLHLSEVVLGVED